MTGKKTPQKNWLEWTTFAVASVLVLGAVGYLAREAVVAGDKPPHIELQLGTPEPRQGHFAVEVTATNTGDESAEQVEIEVTLKGNDGSDERATLRLAFVPRHSKRQGWVAFKTDPGQGQLTARPLGYESP